MGTLVPLQKVEKTSNRLLRINSKNWYFRAPYVSEVEVGSEWELHHWIPRIFLDLKQTLNVEKSQFSKNFLGEG